MHQLCCSSSLDDCCFCLAACWILFSFHSTLFPEHRPMLWSSKGKKAMQMQHLHHIHLPSTAWTSTSYQSTTHHAPWRRTLTNAMEEESTATRLSGLEAPTPPWYPWWCHGWSTFFFIVGHSGGLVITSKVMDFFSVVGIVDVVDPVKLLVSFDVAVVVDISFGTDSFSVTCNSRCHCICSRLYICWQSWFSIGYSTWNCLGFPHKRAVCVFHQLFWYQICHGHIILG